MLLYGLRISMAGVLMAAGVHLGAAPPPADVDPARSSADGDIGIFGVSLNQFLFVLGLSRTSVAHASIFANMSPILVLLLAGASGLERLTPRKLAGQSRCRWPAWCCCA